MTLVSAAARGGAVTLIGQFAKIFVQLAGLAILSRLLAPADFGLIAMVTVIVSFADLVRDFGLSTAAIQARSLDSSQRNNLFWINSLIGLALAVALAVSAPLIAALYGDARLVEIGRWLAIVFLLNGAQTQFQVSLVRAFRFRQITLIELSAQVVGLIGAILGAIWGWGYMALVLQLLLSAATLLILKVVVAGWLPGLYRRSAKVSGFLSYGGHLLGTQLLVYLSTNVDTLLVGRAFGAGMVGQYSRAFQVLNLPMNQVLTPLSNVALPTLSNVGSDFDRAAKYVRLLQSVITFAFAILLGVAVGAAEPLFAIAFGPGWGKAALLFQIVAVAGFFQAASFTTYWLFTSRALTSAQFKSAIAGRSLMVAIIVGASVVSVEAVAAAFAIGCFFSWLIALAWCSRVTQIPTRSLIAVTGSSFVLMCAVGFAGNLSNLFWPQSTDLEALAIAIAASVCVVVTSMIFSPVRQAIVNGRFIMAAVRRREA